MCGIHALLSPSPPSSIPELPPPLKHRLLARGPDHFGQVLCTATPGSTTWSLRFTSSVLALRGDHVARQPLVASWDGNVSSADPGSSAPGSGSVLCWNGEAWHVDGGKRVVEAEENDGEVVLGRLVAAAAAAAAAAPAASVSAAEREHAVLDVLRGIEGPFAFVFFDAASGSVFFGRDRLGRRSLLQRRPPSGGLELCSVAGEDGAGDGWTEVEADGVYVLRLGDGEDATPRRCGWVVAREGAEEDAADFVSGIGRFNKALPAGSCRLTRESPSVQALKDQLLEAMRLRVLNVPPPPDAHVDGDRTRVAVLFSGGLDCTTIARLCHDVLDPDQAVDLLNVAFENPRVVAQLRKANGDLADFYEACPDRITGRKSFAELQRVCPGRKFRFVAVNVPFIETQTHRQLVISLIHPHNTEMDLSIAYALYFAARGQGADELFGGYSRHLVGFQRQGYAGLVDELLLDVGRLGKRNLGRDDRVMAHWGKEVRFPFLDERLVRWAIETPAWEKCDFENDADDSIGGVEAGKRVLRLLALDLGMEGVAREKKRAIQFGSRTAKMESGRVKGTTLISS
ncbi:hypothetical protein VTJ83DRAFT_4382 [Remersonia thermophila]|uniref:Glutamine amidotransferase type-2 domain-containing protein n=1 Tax=Remersonia thermophila TaxID=72144 RepID=A0ABR4DAJ5_9PEZI